MTAPVTCDEYFDHVILQLHFNGANDGVVFTDDSIVANSGGTSEGADGVVTSTAQKKWGTASLKYNNRGRIRLPFQPSYDIRSGDFTLECWLYNDAASNSLILDYSGQSSNQPVTWSISSGTVQAIIKDHAGLTLVTLLDPAPSVPALTWTHVAVVRSGDLFLLFVGGALVDSDTSVAAVLGHPNANAFIGYTSSDTGVTAYMDDMRWTKGIARYTAAFDVATIIPEQFPDCQAAAPTDLAIVTQPQSASVAEGGIATFFVVAVGEGTLHYQWKKDGANVGTDSPLYQTPAATFAGYDGAVYTVVITDDLTSLTSSGATLTVVQNGSQQNCDCEEESPYATLGELRTRLMRRLGYSAMASNPPPGMAALLNDFLQSSQKKIYQKRPDLRTKRIFRWIMQPGQRFYNLSADLSDCGVTLDPTHIDWVGITDLNGRWYQLIKDIPPEWYTTVEQEGLPARYNLQSCIEVFPAPAGAYTLQVKGDFNLTAFVNDEHKTTIDDEVVFLGALADAKAHYKQQDAAAVKQEFRDYLSGMIGDKHATARYIPGVRAIPPAVMPVMTSYIP